MHLGEVVSVVSKFGIAALLDGLAIRPENQDQVSLRQVMD
jgi:hypothetical protein